MRISSLLSPLFVAVVAAAVDADVYKNMDPKRDFCVHAWHQSAVLNNMLYITGGFVVYNYNNTRYEEPNTYLRTLGLTSRFTLNDPTSTPFTFTPNPSIVPEITSGALWPDNNSTLYLASGVTEPVDGNFPNWTAPTTNALWTYQPSTDTWLDFQSPINDAYGTPLLSIAGANTAFVEHDTRGGRIGVGYIAGGNQNPWFAVGYPGMLVYNTTTQTWVNDSTPFQQRAAGVMVHVPIGEQGILVSLGGTRNNLPFPLSQVEIYNLDHGNWSLPMQPATGLGGVPPPRTSFCGVLATAPGNGSYQIFVYGGTDKTGQEQLGDVWVLSMPSFEWFNVYSGANSTGGNSTGANSSLPGGREAHSCHAVAGRYMLVYGGRTKPQEDQPCDKTGVFAFDMVDLKWVVDFAPGGAYKVPEVIADHLNSSARFPQLGLVDPTLEGMFNANATDSIRPQSTGSQDSDRPPGTGSRAKLIGTIVGALVAGVGVIGFVVFILLRRREPAATETTKWVEAPDTFSYYTEMPGHMKSQAWELPAPQGSPVPAESRNSASRNSAHLGLTLVVPG